MESKQDFGNAHGQSRGLRGRNVGFGEYIRSRSACCRGAFEIVESKVVGAEARNRS